MLPKYFTATRMRTGVGCTLLDNFLHVPFLYMPAYFGAVGALQGDSMETTMTVCRAWIQTMWVVQIPKPVRKYRNYAPIPRPLQFSDSGNEAGFRGRGVDMLVHLDTRPDHHLLRRASPS
jgi:hypothetical protein